MVDTKTDLYGRACAAGFPEPVAWALADAALAGDVLNARQIVASQMLYPAHNVPADKMAGMCLRMLKIRDRYHPADVSAVLCRSEEAAALSVALDQLLYGHEPLGAVAINTRMAAVARISPGVITVVSTRQAHVDHGDGPVDPALPDNHWAGDQLRQKVQGPFRDLRQPGEGGLPGIILPR